jgi:hypothetical protein
VSQPYTMTLSRKKLKVKKKPVSRRRR